MPYNGSGANTGLGTTISINTGTVTTPAYTLVGEITTAPLSGRKVNTTDVTNMQSLAQEFKATLITSGSVKISGNYIGTDTGQLALETAFSGKATTLFKIVLQPTGSQTTTGDSFVFSAVVEEMAGFANLGVDKAVQFQATLKISGTITKTAGS